jgi:RNA polymerase sigma-70 factor (ECF subfamily)
MESASLATTATLNRWGTVMDLDVTHSDRKRSYSSIPTGPRSSGQERSFNGESLHSQIEALIPRLTRYARVLACDPVAADDLVQDCLARALGKIHLWERGTDLRAWLFTILHHQYISLARRAARQRASIELQKRTASLMLSPDQTVRLELRDLERAIAKLPEEQRSVILLIGLKGMRYDEAASVVNLPVGTVRSRVSRGRETLRMMTGLFPGHHTRCLRVAVDQGAPQRRAAGRNHQDSRSQ